MEERIEALEANVAALQTKVLEQAEKLFVKDLKESIIYFISARSI